MILLDRLIPAPRLVEIDRIDVGAPAERVWDYVRHGDLARSPFIHALFAAREIPGRIAGAKNKVSSLRVDDLTSTAERPGFQVLLEDPHRTFAVGAIGQVWHANIPFLHVADADAFAAFNGAGFCKVAWEIRVSPRGGEGAHVEIEVRVDATDDESWKKFRRYFRLIGPASRFIRHVLLAGIARELGAPEARDRNRPLPTDELLPDAKESFTHSIDIAATPEAIWPWLVQMGCRRAGYYSIDWLDNAGEPSFADIHPELQSLRVGDIIPATPEGDDGFEVLRIDSSRALVLGGLWDAGADRQLAFASPRPDRYWHVTWAFILEPLDARSTRLTVRASAAFPPRQRLHAAWIRPVHALMETAQLRHLAARAERRIPRDGWRDVLQGVGGAAVMTASLLTPFLRGARSHWGIDAETAERTYPGDGLITSPRWSWTHGIEIDAPAREVWPWVAQIGADKGGFYSYQWLENLAGCDLRNAEAIHPDWEVRAGDRVVLHPKMPPLPIVDVERGRYFVAEGRADERARAAGEPWIEATWLFLVESLGKDRSRVISRYRVATSDDVATRLSFGKALIEPIGFAMDRRMLLGIRGRVERARRAAHALHQVGAVP